MGCHAPPRGLHDDVARAGRASCPLRPPTDHGTPETGGGLLRRLAPIPILVALLHAEPAPAQESRWATVRDDGEHFFDDLVHVWTSPFRADAAAIARAAAVVGGIVLVGIFDDEIQDYLRDHPRSTVVQVLRPFQKSTPISKLGYTKWLIVLSTGLYLSGLAFEWDEIREAGIGCATADVSNTLARHALARIVGRLRPEYTRDPYVIKPFAFGDWEMRSFPGGHAANVAACTAFWTTRFDLGIARPLMIVLATGIGFGRVLDRAHWTTDTLFGLVFGWAAGAIVADQFDRRDDREAAPTPSRRLAPPIRIGWTVSF